MGRANTTRRGPLPAPDVRFGETTLSRYAGAIPMLRFFSEVLELPQRLAVAVPTEGRRRKHPVPHVLYAFLVGALLGIEKLAHLEWLRGDCVVEKSSGSRRGPCGRCSPRRSRRCRTPAWPESRGC